MWDALQVPSQADIGGGVVLTLGHETNELTTYVEVNSPSNIVVVPERNRAFVDDVVEFNNSLAGELDFFQLFGDVMMSSYNPAVEILSKITVSIEPDWAPEVREELDDLLQPGDAWDDDGARPTSAFAVGRARETLQALANFDTPRPSIVPGPDGGVQLEWHLASVELEIEFRPNGQVEALLVDRATAEEKLEEEADDSLLRNWVAMLSDSK